MIELDLPPKARGLDYGGLGLLPLGTFHPSRFVALAADGAVQATGPTDLLIGISQEGTHDAPGLLGSTPYAAVAGQPMAIYSLGDRTCRLEAAVGGFARGMFLTADANGAGVPAAPGDNVGAYSLESADEGELARVLPVFLSLP